MKPHRLPRPSLIPLFISSAAGRRASREYADSLPASERPYWDAYQRATRARQDRERPFRLIAARERLRACHWAGWDHSRDVGRWARGPGEHGRRGPKWLGAR